MPHREVGKDKLSLLGEMWAAGKKSLKESSTERQKTGVQQPFEH